VHNPHPSQSRGCENQLTNFVTGITKTLRELGLIETSFSPRVGFNAHQYTFDGLVKKLAKIAEEDRSKKKWEKYELDDEIEF